MSTLRFDSENEYGVNKYDWHQHKLIFVNKNALMLLTYKIDELNLVFSPNDKVIDPIKQLRPKYYVPKVTLARMQEQPEEVLGGVFQVKN